VFYLRHSSNWNPHCLHSEPFPPKENHNVGLLRFDDDHDHICYRFAQVQIFGGRSNVFKSLQYLQKMCDYEEEEEEIVQCPYNKFQIYIENIFYLFCGFFKGIKQNN
jgi:hypothetical protein